MRITDVEADIVRIPLSTRFSGSVYQIESRCTIVTRVHTDEGLVSEVYSGDERTGYHLLKDLVVGPMKEAVVGEDPTAIERCWQKMFALTPRIADKAIAMRAVAAIDVALWDIAGKSLEVPVRSLLDGYADPAPVVRFAYYVQGRDTEDMVQDLLHQRERGIGGVKLKVGGVSVADDLLRVRAIRDALGDDFIVVCDANQAWTLGEALEFAGPAKEMGLAWLEEPCSLAGRRQRYAPGAAADGHCGGRRPGRKQFLGRPAPDGYRGGGHPECGRRDLWWYLGVAARGRSGADARGQDGAPRGTATRSAAVAGSRSRSVC